MIITAIIAFYSSNIYLHMSSYTFNWLATWSKTLRPGINALISEKFPDETSWVYILSPSW